MKNIAFVLIISFTTLLHSCGPIYDPNNIPPEGNVQVQYRIITTDSHIEGLYYDGAIDYGISFSGNDWAILKVEASHFTAHLEYTHPPGQIATLSIAGNNKL